MTSYPLTHHHAAARPLGWPLLLAGVVLALFGWAAAFTTVGLYAIITGTVALALAAALRPTWRFAFLCGGLIFCAWGGPLLVIAALLGD